ncbi:MAG TPA: hypothetical protein VGM11_00095, partial [Acidobacteriaceae bacterium]
AHAQWTLHDAHTTADLRGIDNVGGGVAWASGSDGTILRTEDAGFVWQLCAKPPGGEHLDFRAIQASDNNTAIAMSSGKGDQSRLYKTTDGCQTWHLLFTNPDKDGFWDALKFEPPSNRVAHPSTQSKGGVSRAVARDPDHHVGFLVGDPVAGRFVIYASTDGNLEQWTRFGEHSSLHEFKFDITPYNGEGLFAASNSNVEGDPTSGITFVTGGPMGAFCVSATWSDHGIGGFPTFSSFKSRIPLAKGVSAGAFSVASSGQQTLLTNRSHQLLVAVGGDYQQPNSSNGTAARSKNGGQHWTAAGTPPHGYRSAVAYDAPTKTWITVGPNGTDISTDDGRNWRALHPDPAFNDTPDADQHWNALSLPYVVGPHGRIGTLRPSALTVKSK